MYMLKSIFRVRSCPSRIGGKCCYFKCLIESICKLNIFVFRELSNKDPRSELGYQLTIQKDPADAARPLAIFHRPSIGSKESSDMADRAVHDSLSMERLLVHTVYIRSLARLADIKSEFQNFLLNDTDCK